MPREEDVMTGHPATQDAPAPEPKQDAPAPDDTIAEIELGGQKFAVDKALAEALKKTQQREEDRFSTLTKTVEQLQNEVRAKGAPAPKEEPDPVLSNTDLLFSNPDQFLAKFSDSLEEKVTRKLTQEYQIAEGRKQFWNTFYDTNKDISREHQLLVDAVMSRDYQELVNLPVGRQFEELGERVREEMLKIVGKKKNGDENQPGRKVRLEAGGNPSPRPAPDLNSQADSKVVGISDILKERRAQRVQARTTKKA